MRITRFVVGAVALSTLFGGCLAYVVHLWMRSQSTATEGALAVRQSLNFGQQWAQEGFVWTLPVHNNTTETIEIEKFVTSCACTTISPATVTIRPHADADVQVTLDLRPKSAEQASQWDRDFGVLIRPVIAGNEANNPEWSLLGRIKNPVLLSRREVDFGTNVVRGSPFPSATVNLTCHPACETITAECDPRFADVALIPGDGDREHRLQIMPHPELPAGRNEFEVTLRLQGRAGAPIPDAQIPVTCRVEHDVEVIPSHLALGRRHITEGLDETVLLRSRTGKTFHIRDVVVSGNHIKVIPAAENNVDKNHLFRVRCDRLEPGSQKNRVRFVVAQEHEKRPFRLSLDVIYHGIVSVGLVDATEARGSD